MPGHLRLPRGTRDRLWRGPLLGAGHLRFDPGAAARRGRGPDRARSVRRARRQDDAARRRRLGRDRGRRLGKSSGATFARIWRAPASSATVVAADMMAWQPPAPVDAILLDAPCSATGIYRRHPDVLHRVRPRAIAELAEAQKAMLARAAGWLKPGGTPGLRGLLARARGRRAGRRRLPVAPRRLPARGAAAHPARRLGGARRRGQLLHRPLRPK